MGGGGGGGRGSVEKGGGCGLGEGGRGGGGEKGSQHVQQSRFGKDSPEEVFVRLTQLLLSLYV